MNINPKSAPISSGLLRKPLLLPLALLGLTWLVLILGFGKTQKPVSQNHGMGWDGEKYFRMYKQAELGERFSVQRPFVYRIATPFLAAQLRMPEARNAFHIVNLVSVLLTGWLIYGIMQVLGAGIGISFFMVVTYFLQWHGPLRQQFYDSFGVDAASQPFVCMLLLCGLSTMRPKSRVLILSSITFIGVFFRESVIFATAAVWIADLVQSAQAQNGIRRALFRDRELVLGLIPMSFGLVGIAITHALSQGTGSYSFILTVLYYLYHKPVLVLIHAFYNGYGTLLIPVLIFWRIAWKHLKFRPLLGIYPLITFVLGWTAGGDTTRINYWGCITLLPLMALVLSELKLKTFGIGIFLFLEVITTRMFFLIPDYPGPEGWKIPFLTNWGSQFPVFDLWSELANPRVLLISLFQYVALTIAGFLWVHIQGKDKYLKAREP